MNGSGGIKMLKEILETKPEKHISSGKFSISSVNSCWRKKYSELKKIYKEQFDEKMFRIFAQGDFFHMQMVKEFMAKGPALGYEVAAAECNIRNNKYISGRCDMLLSNTKTKKLYVVDFKSCSPWAFKNVQKGVVSQTYQDQVLLYMHIFHIPKGYLLFINKASSEIEEFEVEYNALRAEWLIGQIKFFFQNFVEKDVFPSRCDGGVFGCKCCWPDEPKNTPSEAQLAAVLKQQIKIPELFKEFEQPVETTINPVDESTTVAPLPHPKSHTTATAILSDSGKEKASGWVKVL